MGYSILAQKTLLADSPSLDLTPLDLSGWRLVRLISILRTVTAGPWDRSILRFNDDAARNYLWSVRNNDTVGAGVNNDDTVTYIAGIEAAHLAGANLNAAYWATNHIDLVDPGVSDAYKVANLWSGNMPINAYSLATYGTGIWKSTAPITKISQVGNNGQNVKAGSRAVLLGIVPVTSSLTVDPDPPPAKLVRSDDFNRANGALGANWTIPDAGKAITILNNAARGGNTNPSHDAYWSADVFAADQYSQAKVPGALSAAGWLGVTVRATGNANNYLLIYFNNAGSYQLLLFRGNGTAYTQIGTTFTIGASPLAAGDVIRIEAQGTTIRGLVNGVTRITTTDANRAAGRPGISTFTIGESLDDWEGGEL